MSDSVISVENLSKRYVISHEARHDNLRDTLHHTARKLWRRMRWGTGFRKEEFWALRDVSFDVKRGEVIGIIGRNGAGKSTLLKVLSRITEPTEGTITIKGRVASLLEVGTGFHPELSGRENVYLNGAILGMSRAEIRRKFDEIVAFAEVEKFLDTQVKHYSSGMYVRLAFAVAAHLEPEILIVDEVLAVGDQEFQRKCLGKIENVTRNEGRTVLFVSHNLASVRQLCTRALLLEQGQLVEGGPPEDVIQRYAATIREGRTLARRYKHIRGDGRASIERISFQRDAVFSVFSPIKITIDYALKEDMEGLDFFLLIYGDEGDCLAASFQSDSGSITRPTGRAGTVSATFQNPLSPGRYLVSAGIFDRSRQFLDWVEFAETFQIESAFASGKNFDHRLGRVSLLPSWTN